MRAETSSTTPIVLTEPMKEDIFRFVDSAFCNHKKHRILSFNGIDSMMEKLAQKMIIKANEEYLWYRKGGLEKPSYKVTIGEYFLPDATRLFVTEFFSKHFGFKLALEKSEIDVGEELSELDPFCGDCKYPEKSTVPLYIVNLSVLLESPHLKPVTSHKKKFVRAKELEKSLFK